MNAKRDKEDLVICYREIGNIQWVFNVHPMFNWGDYEYIIGDNTKDGLFLHELLDKMENGAEVLYNGVPSKYKTPEQILESYLNSIKHSVIKYYSIKEEPKYRAYKNFEEAKACFDKVVVDKINGGLYNVVEVPRDEDFIGIGTGDFSRFDAFDEFTFEDGTPLGVKI
jgi:hypothetical protein